MTTDHKNNESPVVLTESNVVPLTSTFQSPGERTARQPRNRPPEDDPYTVILLAAGELEAHRIEQAEYLIERAFALYDQCDQEALTLVALEENGTSGPSRRRERPAR